MLAPLAHGSCSVLRLEAGLDSASAMHVRADQSDETALPPAIIDLARPTDQNGGHAHSPLRPVVHRRLAPRLARRGSGTQPAGTTSRSSSSRTSTATRSSARASSFMKDGRVIGRYDTGFADRAANVRVDSQTIYHWGSITKSLTAISIMQLRDRGKLSLDDKIVRWVPELRAMHDPYGMMDSITHPDAAVAHRRISESDVAVRQRQAVGAVRADDVESARRDDAVPGAASSNPDRATATRIPGSSTSRASSSRSPATRGTPTSRRTSSRRSSLTAATSASTPYFLAEHRSHNYYVRKDSVGRGAADRQRRRLRPGHHLAERRVERAAQRSREVHRVPHQRDDPRHVARAVRRRAQAVEPRGDVEAGACRCRRATSRRPTSGWDSRSSCSTATASASSVTREARRAFDRSSISIRATQVGSHRRVQHDELRRARGRQARADERRRPHPPQAVTALGFTKATV